MLRDPSTFYSNWIKIPQCLLSKKCSFTVYEDCTVSRHCSRVSDKPISFELSIGNAGNSLDGEHLSGKVDHVDTHAHEDDGKEGRD